MAERILAVGHDAYRAGAQIVFLHILRWLRDHGDVEMSLVLNGDGALLDDYAALLPTAVIPEPDDSASAARAMPFLPARARRLLRRRPRPLHPVGVEPASVDVVYANSITTAPLAARLAAELRCPAVCHVHELETSIRRLRRPVGLREAMRVIDRFIAVSGAVERNLVVNHGISAARIDRINGCVPVPPPPVDSARRVAVLSKLGVPRDAFVVGGCGTADWRKGPDVFLLIAKAVGDEVDGRPVRFVWVGGEPDDLHLVEHDRERLGLGKTVHFVGIKPDPSPYFSLFDTFLLSSREDPFPLACLEAAAYGVPVVCFADAGGMPEFVEDDAGVVVPYLDVAGAAEQLTELVRCDERRRALGSRAAAKVAQRCSVDAIGPKIAAVLARYRR